MDQERDQGTTVDQNGDQVPANPNPNSGVIAGGLEYLKNGVKISPVVNFEEWNQIGENLALFHAVTPWMIGDWYLFGESKFGEMAAQARAIGDAASVRGWQLKPETVQTYASACRAYPIDKRIELLTFQHHRLVQGDPKKEELLQYAAEHEMDTRSFRAYLAKEKNGGNPPADKKTPAEVKREIVEEIGQLVSKALEATDLITEDTKTIVELLHEAQAKIDRYLGN